MGLERPLWPTRARYCGAPFVSRRARLAIAPVQCHGGARWLGAQLIFHL